MKRSLFMFEPTTDEYIEVWWAQVSSSDEVPQYKMIGRVPDTTKFRRMFQGHLEMRSDDSWSPQGKWTEDGWYTDWSHWL